MKYGSLILEKKEYILLKRLLNLSGPNKNAIEIAAVKNFNEELKKAMICDEEDMPADVVRLNSVVTMHSGDWKKTFQLVMPSARDDKSDKISIMSPIGINSIGRAMGDRFSWQSPSGGKEVLIKKVERADNSSSILI